MVSYALSARGRNVSFARWTRVAACVLVSFALLGTLGRAAGVKPDETALQPVIICHVITITGTIAPGTGGPTGTFSGTVTSDSSGWLTGATFTEAFILGLGTYSATITFTTANGTLSVSKSGPTTSTGPNTNTYLLGGTFTITGGTGAFALFSGSGIASGSVTPDFINEGLRGCFNIGGCREFVNPHGQTIPPAGHTTLPGPKGGENEDGFYLITGTPAATHFTVNGLGPFPIGSTIKVTEAPGTATPGTVKPMGSSNGQAGAVLAHVTIPTDPVFTVFAGPLLPLASFTCYVPPPPK